MHMYVLYLKPIIFCLSFDLVILISGILDNFCCQFFLWASLCIVYTLSKNPFLKIMITCQIPPSNPSLKVSLFSPSLLAAQAILLRKKLSSDTVHLARSRFTTASTTVDPRASFSIVLSTADVDEIRRRVVKKKEQAPSLSIIEIFLSAVRCNFPRPFVSKLILLMINKEC